ncbi:DUF4925 domain-containing protein [Phocaeicola barnesiae]|uniref:DUF4925 domain-containing protein n=1 Tax=Phocaeicola barnesiae TaxID=376804 RepID=UPI001F1F0A59|nr:DUF4925 domain-containing protein [Phocaeicola barnesiae]MCF2576936.1 DUF4925 domain-containing protein [Phocaeicola barnesiae]
MKLKLVLALLVLGVTPVIFTSCGDDTPDKGFELISYLDGNYTPTDDACHLSATINGKEVSEKASVTFHTKDLQTGNMVLKNFFEGYASLEIEEFTLIQETEGESVRFTFTGTQRVDETLQFSYSGYVVYGKLYIEFNIQ